MISRSVLRETASEIIRFGIATGLSAIVSLGLPITLHELFGVDQRLAVGISQATVLAMNFLTLRLFVFRSSGPVRTHVVRYAVSAVVFRGLEYASFLVLFEVIHLFYVTALVVTLFASTLTKFIWYRYIFGQSVRGPERSLGSMY